MLDGELSTKTLISKVTSACHFTFDFLKNVRCNLVEKTFAILLAILLTTRLL